MCTRGGAIGYGPRGARTDNNSASHQAARPVCRGFGGLGREDTLEELRSTRRCSRCGERAFYDPRGNTSLLVVGCLISVLFQAPGVGPWSPWNARARSRSRQRTTQPRARVAGTDSPSLGAFRLMMPWAVVAQMTITITFLPFSLVFFALLPHIWIATRRGRTSPTCMFRVQRLRTGLPLTFISRCIDREISFPEWLSNVPVELVRKIINLLK